MYKRFNKILFFLTIVISSGMYCLEEGGSTVSRSVEATSNNIVIGTSLPLRKEGRVVLRGMDLVFRKVNQEGGIKGRKIVLSALDDGKSIGRSVDNINKLAPITKVVSNIFTRGVVEELLDSAKENKLLLFAPEEANDRYRKAEYKGLLHIKASIKKELKGVIRYAVKQKKKYTFAVFYEDSTIGRRAEKLVKKILEKYSAKSPHIRYLGFASHPRGTVDIADAVTTLNKLSPEAIICISRRHATYNFILECMNLGLFRTTFLSTSYLLPIQELMEKTRGVTFHSSSVLPNPKKSDLPIVKEYREAMKRVYPKNDFDTISLGGYVSASILVELIKRVDGKVTHEKIIAEAEKLQDFDLGGMVLSFDPQTRNLYRSVWISPGKRNKWVMLEAEGDNE